MLLFCVTILGIFFWITALDFDFGFDLIMDSDHSSASHFDLLESDLDRAGTDLDFASAPAVDDSAAPPSASPLGFHRCACGRRMSSKTHDHHAFCVTCSGYQCDFKQSSVPSSRYVSLSLEECARLEACMRGLVGSQSYAFWAMVSIFAFLRDSGLSPSVEVFNKVVSSRSVALTAQVKALYATSAFLKQMRRETYVAHLPAHTHDSMKHAVLSTPSEDSLFSEEVIQRSLGQVRDDSQLQLLCNLSTQRSEKGSASSSSTPAQRRRRSPGSQKSASSSSRDSSYQSRFSRSYKRAASSSPARHRSPKCASKSPANKKANFRK